MCVCVFVSVFVFLVCVKVKESVGSQNHRSMEGGHIPRKCGKEIISVFSKHESLALHLTILAFSCFIEHLYCMNGIYSLTASSYTVNTHVSRLTKLHLYSRVQPLIYLGFIMKSLCPLLKYQFSFKNWSKRNPAYSCAE